MTRILAINGAYRDDGITDQAVVTVVQAAAAGAEVEMIHLRGYPIEFCLNCRECTQQPGTAPGQCVQHDGMAELVGKIEAADAFILASPTHFSTATALFKRFMERLIVYAYWPWAMHSPQLRKAGEPRKKAVLITSCAAPVILGCWAYGTRQHLQMAAKRAQVLGRRLAGEWPDPHASLSSATKYFGSSITLTSTRSPAFFSSLAHSGLRWRRCRRLPALR